MAEGTKTIKELIDDLEQFANELERSPGIPRNIDLIYSSVSNTSKALEKHKPEDIESRIRLNCLVDRIKSNIASKTSSN